MQIKDWQKNNISTFLRAKGIYHEDLHHEILDHIIMSVESEMEENSSLYFE